MKCTFGKYQIFSWHHQRLSVGVPVEFRWRLNLQKKKYHLNFNIVLRYFVLHFLCRIFLFYFFFYIYIYFLTWKPKWSLIISVVFPQIPNPLFDLAGITCGHFLVPFWTFFGATLIGKAVVKMHIQVSCCSVIYIHVNNARADFQKNQKKKNSIHKKNLLRTNCTEYIVFYLL